MNEEKTTIIIFKTTRDRMKKYMHKKESYDAFIDKLISYMENGGRTNE